MKDFDIIIIGGGTAGITTAARLRKKNIFKSIALIEPSETHYYQPLWTLVGAGLVKKDITTKPMKDVIPSGVEWIKESAIEINAEANSIKTDKQEMNYKYLIVATGIIPDWTYAEGLEENIGKNGICSVYTFEHSDYTFECIKNAKSGNMIYTMPMGILKCGGAPQKIMWLSEDYHRVKGDRDKFTFNFNKEGEGIFGVPKYAKMLDRLVVEREIKTNYNSKLVSVDGVNKKATFKNLKTNEENIVDYEVLHVSPHFKTHDFIRNSNIVNESGEVAVDKDTLQSNKFKNIFSLGDCSSLPCGKTGAAIRKQAPVLVENLVAYEKGLPLTKKYNGYTACPVLTRHNRVVLAEFDYDGNVCESFPFNQAKESWLMFLFKRYGLPQLYWKFMLRGLA
jgi:sulfide:quinone oxidoreductase